MNGAIDELHRYWFGELPGDGRYDAARMHLWFEAGQRYDEEIGARFGALHRQAAAGELEHWKATPRGWLALVLLLDQISRHIYRRTPRAFAQDPQAQALVLEGLEQGVDRRLQPIERTFFYLPLEHAEDLALQRRSVACFQELLAELPAELRPDYQGFLDYAIRHLRVIERFGRFPDLNPILGRDSTAEELKFLEQPGSSFL
ncbi:MAG TPA: DUF924 family protein [Candidatus Competibacteraceae bacterium]|nr:DUF924 family protein [Candidatus Competibacteraceae bacterium]